jgi:Antitoxin VbhA
MPVNVLSVREARTQLPSILEGFRGGDRRPVFLGSHRKTEAVMVPVEVYEELVARRRKAIDRGNASLRAEGLEPPANIEVIVDEWVHGRITSTEMEEHIADLYGLPR